MTKPETMQYRKKPVVVEAIRFDGTSEGADRVIQFTGRDDGVSYVDTEHGRRYDIFIDTLEGRMTAQPGDWIIKGVNGEFYPCKPDIFAKTYEGVSSSEPPATEIPEEDIAIVLSAVKSQHKSRIGGDWKCECGEPNWAADMHPACGAFKRLTARLRTLEVDNSILTGEVEQMRLQNGQLRESLNEMGPVRQRLVSRVTELERALEDAKHDTRLLDHLHSIGIGRFWRIDTDSRGKPKLYASKHGFLSVRDAIDCDISVRNELANPETPSQ